MGNINVYDLKRRYGHPLTIEVLVTSTTNRATGIKTDYYRRILIPKAVPNPKKLSFNPFKGLFTDKVVERDFVLVDKNDVKEQIPINCFCVIGGKRFRLTDVIDNQDYYILQLEAPDA